MQNHSVNIPRLEYFHRKFDELNMRFTELDRRINDVNQKVEFTKVIIQKLENYLGHDQASATNLAEETKKEVREIKTLLINSKLIHERMRKFRLPL